MDFIAIINDTLFSLVGATVNELFSMDSRQSIIYIMIAYIVAFFIYKRSSRAGIDNAQGSFGRFIGWKKILLHPSSIIDFQYFFVQSAISKIIIIPIIVFIFAEDFVTGESFFWIFTAIFGEMTDSLDVTTKIMILYAIGAFLIGDFTHYWVHRVFHLGFLWEFHKVHHSAEILVPLTAARVHPVEKLVESICVLFLLSIYGGFFMYLCDSAVSPYTIFGVSFIVMMFNSIAANLRHTHIWLSFGSVIEYVINSPAQHQIHHSINPMHYNKNFGTNLSIWDWMFGTLYVTSSRQEDIEFGLSKRENRNYYTLNGIMFYPFKACYRRCKKFL